MQSTWKFLFISFFTFLNSFTGLLAYLPCDCYPVSWEGVYLSGQLGMGADREHTKFTNLNYFNTLGPAVLGTTFKHKSEGFIGGAALGYNYQADRLVFGVEAGGVSSNFKKTRKSPFFPATDVFSSHLECITTAKIRLGYSYDTLLTFISGGWAGGHDVLQLKDTQSGISAKLKTWVNGWTVGAGFDCRCADWFSLGLAYDYIQFQYHGKTATCPSCGVGVGLGSPALDNRFQVQTLTLRFNYFFNC